ncbi:hypothetical protein BGX34_005842 [Mortierella sp. NVP85]|nr:hypothetical protein BGX34_005842 [Mortierella sp. NVP85]
MAISPNELLMQAFRSRSTDRIINISTVKDGSDQYGVLWGDIQNMFKNAVSIKDGESLVPFMTDEHSRRINPLQIAYHPGVVLEVVEQTNSQVNASRGTTDLSNGALSGTRQSSGITTDTTLVTLDAVALALSRMSIKIDSTIIDHKRLSEGPQSSVGIFNELHGSYREAVLSGQEMETKRFKQSIGDYFQQFQKAMDRNKTLQKYLLSVQQQQQRLQQEALEELRKQKAMEEEQERIRQTLDRLAAIQNRSRELLLHEYELHEGSIPRLFIVLPKATGLCNRSTRSIAKRFRLYFLCECGIHTMSEGCETPHEIHLAKHEGYNLNKATEFFQKYGTYLLTMMHMVKYGATAAGMTVPPLANFMVANDPADDSKHVEYIRKNIESLVDDTINYLQSINPGTGADIELNAGQLSLNKPESLKNADMLQLESHLKANRQGRISGNMYRIANSDGHVKWVCSDHYFSSHQKSAVQQLRDIVKANRGKYTEAVGRVEIKIASNSQAMKFYDALVKARVIQELRITFGWDATMDELRSFASAVTTANLLHLTIDGTRLKGPKFDVLNRNRRFDPILANSRLQSLHLKGFDEFFSRVGDSVVLPTLKLRMFAMDPNIPSNPKSLKSFNGFLDHCPSLAIMMLKLPDQYSITEALDNFLNKLHKLESLYIDCSNLSVIAGVTESKIQNTILKIKRLDGLSQDDLRFIQQGHLTQLQIEYTPQEAVEDRLADALRHNPRLSLLEVGCDEMRYLALTNLVVSTRAALLQKHGSCHLRTFVLMEDGLVPFEERGNFDDKTHLSSRITFPEDSLTFEMHTWLRIQDQRPISGHDPVCEFLGEYGWSVVDCRVPWTITDDFMATLADATSRRDSELERIVIYPLSLPDSALDYLDRIIGQSSHFFGLGLLLYQLGWKQVGRVERALYLLRRYRQTVFGILMYGDSVEDWLPHFASSFPTRDFFPNMTSFTVTSDNAFNITPECFDWILTMITTPPPEGQLKKVTTIQLGGIRLDPEDWRALIEALDITTLEHFSIGFTNLAEEQFNLLVKRILDTEGNDLPLKSFKIPDTDVVNNTNPSVMEASFAKLRKKAPLINIVN